MTFKPRTFVVPLYGGDFQQRIAQAEQKVAEAEKREKDGKTTPRLMHERETEVDRLVREHNELVEQAEADGCTKVTLRALGRKRWNALVEEHPPRTGESVPTAVREVDEAIGVNDETFSEALLSYSDPSDSSWRTIAAVSDETPTADLLDAVSSAQFDLLYRTAFALNRDGGPAPKVLTPSPSTDATAS